MSEGPTFQLNIISRERTIAAPDPDLAKRKKDRENGRQQAQLYANEALLRAVAIMRNSKDESQVLKAIKMITDRAWGIPKSADEEEANAKNQSIIEILAAFSSTTPQMTHQPLPAIEADPAQPYVMPAALLDDLLVDAEDNDNE